MLLLMRETSKHYQDSRVRSGDDVLRKHLFERSGIAQCIRPEVLNCLLNVSLSCLQQNLLECINNTPCWSLLCDESSDFIKREQLCIGVCYISEVNGEFSVHEDPICLTDAVKSIPASQLLACIGTDNDVRLTGQNMGTIIGNKCHNLD